MTTKRTDPVSPSTPLVDVVLYDYGVGNLHSIKNALLRSGARVQVTQDPHVLLEAPAIVLPGVGAFAASMKTLTPIREQLRKRLTEGTPCLAVCIGMQLLFEESEESPGVRGIGYFQGTVRTLPANVGKIPHLGWNTLTPPANAPRWEQGQAPVDWRPILPPDDTYAYFVHSFHTKPRGPITLATTHYGPDDNAVEIAAIVARGNTFATQFHPEKSSTAGLRLIRGWVETVRHATRTDATPEASPQAAKKAPEPDQPPEPDREESGKKHPPEGKH